MYITRIKALWPEKSDFVLERQDIGDEYIFIHLLTDAILTVGGENIKCPAGSAIIHPKHSYHYIAATGDGLLHNWAHIKGNVEEIASEYGFEIGKLYHTDDESLMTGCFQDIELSYLAGGKLCEELCDVKLREMMIRLVMTENTSEKREYSGDMRDSFVSARTAVHTNYAKNWTTEEMAALVHLSPSRFFVLYKAIFGVTPKSDLLNIRMEHAKNFLSLGRYSVKEVAEMTGYTNVYHFIRSFRENEGVTPGKFFGNK